MTATDPSHGFLSEPALTPELEAYFASDVTDHGYVMNLSRVWAQSPAAHDTLFALLADMVSVAGLSFRQRGILVAATASTIGDSYCALAWGGRLATAAGDGSQAPCSAETTSPSTPPTPPWRPGPGRGERPQRHHPADLEPLRAAGFDDRQIFAITVFVALRRAFSTVNDALGPLPDHQLRADAPPAVDDAVSFGRPAADQPS